MINQTVCNMSGTVYQNYKKHSRCISQQCLSIQQYNSMSWLITKVSYPYLSAIPSVSFSYYTLRSHIKHTVCLCVSYYYICGEVTHNWYVTFLFHLTLYILVLCQPVTKMWMCVNTAGSERRNRSDSWIQREGHRESYKNVWKYITARKFNFV